MGDEEHEQASIPNKENRLSTPSDEDPLTLIPYHRTESRVPPPIFSVSQSLESPPSSSSSSSSSQRPSSANNRVVEFDENSEIKEIVVPNPKRPLWWRTLNALHNLEEFERKLETQYDNKAFFLLGNKNIVRRAAIFITDSKWFEWLILLVIIANCGLLAVFDPLNPGSWRNALLDYSGYVFTTIFTLEMLLRMISQGLVLHQGSYFRDGWNILDCFIVVTGLIDICATIIFGNVKLTFLSTFRMFRLLRPLRAVTSFPSMRLIVSSVLKSIPMLFNAIILFMVFVLFFGIVGVQLLKGTSTQTCFDIDTGDIIDKDDYICGSGWGANVCPDGYECRYRETGTSPYGFGYMHFDNILNAMLVMFQISTGEEWTATTANFIDSNGYYVIIYFSSAVMIGSIFIVNLVVAILTDFFDRNVKEEKKNLSRSRRRSQIRIQKNTLRKIKEWANNIYNFVFDHPLYEKMRLLRWFSYFQKGIVRKVVASNAFGALFTALVVLNTAIMTIDYYGMPIWLDEVTDVANYFFIGLFAVELVLKLFGLGLREFLSDPFNIFDSVVVIFSIIELFFHHDSGFTALRTVRLLRVFKLARFIESLRILLQVIYKSMWSVGSLLMLLLLALFIYTLIGMQLFGGKFDFPEEDGVPETNYDTLYWGMITNFIVIVSDDWTHILFDAMRAEKGPGPIVGALFMTSLFVIGNYILLNLFIAVLMSQFGDIEDDDKDSPETLPSLEALRKKLSYVIQHGRNVFSRGWHVFPYSDAKRTQIANTENDLREGGDTSISNEQDRSTSSLHRIDTFSTDVSKARTDRLEKLSHEEDVLIYEQLIREMQDIENNAQDTSIIGAIRTTIRDYILSFFKDRNQFKNSWGSLFVAKKHPERAEKMPLEKVTLSNWHILLYEFLLVDEGEAKIRKLSRLRMLNLKKGLGFEEGQQYISSTQSENGPHEDISKEGGQPIEEEVDNDGNNQVPGEELDWSLPLESGPVEADEGQGHDNSFHIGMIQTEATVPTWPKRILRHIHTRLFGNYSLFIFPNSRCRRILRETLESKYFEAAIMVAIFISTLALAINSPFNTQRDFITQVLSILNISLTALFTCEAVTKIIVMGLIVNKQAYLRDVWNVMDFVIVIIGIVGIFVESNELSALRALRLLRALRPLRFVNKIGGLKAVVDTLINSIPSIINVVLLASLIFLIFAIMGVTLFSGSFYSCTDETKTTRATCEETPGAMWITPPDNFDNIFTAMLTLFEITFVEGWAGVMYLCASAVGREQAPIPLSNPPAALFVIIFIIVGAFFFNNLFVGVLIDNYQSLVQKRSGSALLTKAQREWVEIQRIMLLHKPERQARRPQNKVRRVLFSIVNHFAFEILVSCLVLLAIVVLGMEFYPSTPEWSFALMVSSYTFTFIFTGELILKIIAYGSQFFYKWIHILDTIIAVLNIASFITNFLPNVSLINMSIFRVIRVVRVLRIARMAKKIRTLISTMVLSLPSLINVSLLLLLLMSIYSILGVQLFYNVPLTTYPLIDSHFNFQNFFSAFFTLFRILFGENWNDIMHVCMTDTEPFCSRKLNTCGNYWAGIAYFCSFMLLGSSILLNLFVAVILDNFGTSMQAEHLVISQADIERYIREWRRNDPEMTLFMDATKFPLFLVSVGKPLGVARGTNPRIIRRMISLLNIKTYDGKIHYFETLVRLSEFHYGQRLPPDFALRMASKWKAVFPKKVEQQLDKAGVAEVIDGPITIQHIYAAMKMQAIWRRRVRERKLQRQQQQEQLQDKKSVRSVSSIRFLPGTQPYPLDREELSNEHSIVDDVAHDVAEYYGLDEEQQEQLLSHEQPENHTLASLRHFIDAAARAADPRHGDDTTLGSMGWIDSDDSFNLSDIDTFEEDDLTYLDEGEEDQR